MEGKRNQTGSRRRRAYLRVEAPPQQLIFLVKDYSYEILFGILFPDDVFQEDEVFTVKENTKSEGTQFSVRY